MAAPGEKLRTLRVHLATGNTRAALKLAATFPRLGPRTIEIRRAWEALVRPAPYREMGFDIDATVAAGYAALKERYER